MVAQRREMGGKIGKVLKGPAFPAAEMLDGCWMLKWKAQPDRGSDIDGLCLRMGVVPI